MAAVYTCPSCRERLQVPPSLIRHDVQCPKCNSTFVASEGGRTSALPPAGLPPVRDHSPYDHFGNFSDDEYDEQRVDPRVHRRRDLHPHRAGFVLALGIVGVFLPVVAPFAWFLGHQDLLEIKAGQMDPDGESLLQVGWVLGIVGSVMLMLNVGVILLMLCLALL